MTTASVSNEEFTLMREYIEKQCGIALGDEKAYLIETRLTKLMVKSGCEDFGEFYRLVKSNKQPQLRDQIVDAMTTNETLWFRDSHPFTILREKLLPAFADEIRAGKRQRVRIWSAASSTGQEAYSIAMTVHEFAKTQSTLKPEHVEIVGTDISPSALFVATTGRYDQIAVSRGLPDDLRGRYFKQDGRTWILDDAVKKLAKFQRFNLQNPPAPLGKFDVVFLRYVAIYFSDDFKKKVFSNVASILSPPGYFIIGAVESLRGYSDAFENLSHASGTYYKRIG